MKENVYVLFHGNCQDGFGAAWSAYKKFGSNAVYVPCVYGTSIPEVPTDATVYMIDFSLKREEMLALKSKVSSIVVLDHHKTAEKELEGLDFCHFDMNKSGAMLAWDYFHPNDKIPDLICYVQDRDLWKHTLPSTKEYNAALSAYPKEFSTWSYLSLMPVSVLVIEGEAILRYQNQLVEEICNNSELINIDGNKVAIVNATSHWSDCGAYLLSKYPECDYAASYYFADGKKKWSLRSRGMFDVSIIAKKHGGGGHLNASGYVENIKE